MASGPQASVGRKEAGDLLGNVGKVHASPGSALGKHPSSRHVRRRRELNGGGGLTWVAAQGLGVLAVAAGEPLGTLTYVAAAVQVSADPSVLAGEKRE